MSWSVVKHIPMMLRCVRLPSRLEGGESAASTLATPFPRFLAPGKPNLRIGGRSCIVVLTARLELMCGGCQLQHTQSFRSTD